MHTDIDGCAVNNGGCDHICIDKVAAVECKCKVGYEMTDDGMTCKRK